MIEVFATSQNKMSSKSWDMRPGWKLTVLVKDAKLDTAKKHGGEDTRNPFVTVRMGGTKNKQQQKTPTLKRTLIPQWREVFFLEAPPFDQRGVSSSSRDGGDACEPFLEIVVSDSGLRTHLIGIAIVKLRDLREDTLVMVTRRLRKKVKDKGGDKKSDMAVVGEIHLVMHLTRRAWVPAPRPFGPFTDKEFTFLYERNMKQFHPGDIILYNTTGPAAALLRVDHEVQWSHCGIVVEMPNRWTREPELCVLEFCSNRENYIDCYNDAPIHNGPMVFRLAERIHGFHGTEAWLMPLRKPLSRPQVQSLTQWALELICDYNRTVTCKYKDDRMVRLPFSPFPFTPSQQAYFEKIGVSLSTQSAYCEYYSPEMMSLGLCYVGLQVQKRGVYTTIKELSTSKLFLRPFLIRCRKQFAETPEWPYEAQSGKTHNSSSHEAEKPVTPKKQPQPAVQQAVQQAQPGTAEGKKLPVPKTDPKSHKRKVPTTPLPMPPKTPPPVRPVVPIPAKELPSTKPMSVEGAAAKPQGVDPKHLRTLSQTALLYTNSCIVAASVPDDEDPNATTPKPSESDSSDEEVDESAFSSDSDDDFFVTVKEDDRKNAQVSHKDTDRESVVESDIEYNDDEENDEPLVVSDGTSAISQQESGKDSDKESEESEDLSEDSTDDSDSSEESPSRLGPSPDNSDSEDSSDSNPATTVSGSFLEDDDDTDED